MPYQATGIAIKNEINTSATKSLLNSPQRFKTDAPNTLRTPISLVRCSAMKDASPNKPRQLMNIANTAKKVARLLTRSSLLNFFAYSSSSNLYWKGEPGLYFLNTAST